MAEEKAKVLLNVFDGTRRPINSEVNLLIKLVDGTQKQVFWGHRQGPSVSYYKDLAAHAILEVIPNHFRGPTDPVVAYVLRWIAGRHAEAPEFNPP